MLAHKCSFKLCRLNICQKTKIWDPAVLLRLDGLLESVISRVYNRYLFNTGNASSNIHGTTVRAYPEIILNVVPFRVYSGLEESRGNCSSATLAVALFVKPGMGTSKKQVRLLSLKCVIQRWAPLALCRNWNTLTERHAEQQNLGEMWFPSSIVILGEAQSEGRKSSQYRCQ